MHHHHGRHRAHPHGVPSIGAARARRGEVPAAVLSLLKEEDMHGYQIIQEISDRTNGAWSPSPGSIYPTLQTLEDQKMVTSETVGGKRVFSLTEVGRTHADLIPEGEPWTEFAVASGPEQRLRESFIGLMQAARQVGGVGTEEQVAEAAEILGDARKRMYAILGGE